MIRVCRGKVSDRPSGLGMVDRGRCLRLVGGTARRATARARVNKQGGTDRDSPACCSASASQEHGPPLDRVALHAWPDRPTSIAAARSSCAAGETGLSENRRSLKLIDLRLKLLGLYQNVNSTARAD